VGHAVRHENLSRGTTSKHDLYLEKKLKKRAEKREAEKESTHKVPREERRLTGVGITLDQESWGT